MFMSPISCSFDLKTILDECADLFMENIYGFSCYKLGKY
jgi:hypothetical protein